MTGIERDAARGRFFAIISELVPEAMEDLAGEPAERSRVADETTIALKKLFEGSQPSYEDIFGLRALPPDWLFENTDEAKMAKELWGKLVAGIIDDALPELLPGMFAAGRESPALAGLLPMIVDRFFMCGRLRPGTIERTLEMKAYRSYLLGKALEELDRRSPKQASSVREQRKAFGASVEAWCRRWRLDADWCTAVAFSILHDWHADAGALRKRSVLPSVTPMFSPTEAMVPAWVCDLPSIDWDPKADLWKHGQELRKDARNRLRAKATKAIDGYLNRVEALARDRGFEALPAIDEHLKWLVRRQVKGEPERRIAKTTRKARSTIHTALEETAKFLDLPLRDPEPIGRPRRTAD